MQNSKVILYFIDGLGIGTRNENNPLSNIENIEPLAHFQVESKPIIFDGVLVPTDACLGVEGRPQSASGQTTILTGVNAPKFLGMHKQGFPNQKLRDVIAENSIFLQLKKLGIEPNLFANAYTKQYFETHYKRWKSATTCAVEAAEMSVSDDSRFVRRICRFARFYQRIFARAWLRCPVTFANRSGQDVGEIS